MTRIASFLSLNTAWNSFQYTRITGTGSNEWFLPQNCSQRQRHDWCTVTIFSARPFFGRCQADQEFLPACLRKLFQTQFLRTRGSRLTFSPSFSYVPKLDFPSIYFPSIYSTFAVRETASLGIMGAPRVPPLNPTESIVLSEHYRL